MFIFCVCLFLCIICVKSINLLSYCMADSLERTLLLGKMGGKSRREEDEMVR